jgi:hypothetical protein
MLQMIRYGMTAGFAVALTLAVLHWLSRPAGPGAAGGGDELGDQVWHVLAEARRITEESARGL